MSWTGRSQRDFDEEIRSHIAIEIDRLVEAGYSYRDAEIEARRTFGNIGIAQDRFHHGSRRAWVEDVVTDIRYALRRIRLHKAFSGSVIGIAALGIFASTATFSIVSGILIQPLPFRDASRVGLIQLETDATSSARLSMGA